MVVEPESWAIGAIEKSPDRKEERWASLFESFPSLEYIIRDFARGIKKGATIKGCS